MKNNDYSSNLTYIEGDLPVSPAAAGGDFVMAEVTNTRLMGVMGLHVVRNNKGEDLHQFFYLDAEEYGFEEYQSIHGTEENGETPETVMQEMFGGLGGAWKTVSEREAIHILKEIAAVNFKRKNPLPDQKSEYMPFLMADPKLSSDEKAKLWGKIAKIPEKDYELINYFFMRMVGKDYPAMNYLTGAERPLKPIKMDTPGTLFLNKIEEATGNPPASGSTRSYMVNSLVEDETTYRNIYSKITVIGPKVLNLEIVSDMEISFWEMSMVLKQPEYLVHLNVAPSLEENNYDELLLELFPTATKYDHEEGDLYMIFREDNNHVGDKEYRLDHDVLSTLYLCHDNEVLIAGYDPIYVSITCQKFIEKIKRHGCKAAELGKYNFPSATLVAYIDRGFGSFDEYLDFMRNL